MGLDIAELRVRLVKAVSRHTLAPLDLMVAVLKGGLMPGCPMEALRQKLFLNGAKMAVHL